MDGRGVTSPSDVRGPGEQKEGVTTGWAETEILASRKLVLDVGTTMSEQPCHLGACLLTGHVKKPCTRMVGHLSRPDYTFTLTLSFTC